jgi:hypothetical protein
VYGNESNINENIVIAERSKQKKLWERENIEKLMELFSIFTETFKNDEYQFGLYCLLYQQFLIWGISMGLTT